MTAEAPELVLRRGSRMTIRLESTTAELPKFFIGAEIRVMGLDATIEKMETLQSVVPGQTGLVPLELTVLLL